MFFDKVCANDLSLAKRRLSSKSGLGSETLYDCQHHGPCDPNRMDDYKDGAPAFAREACKICSLIGINKNICQHSESQSSW